MVSITWARNQYGLPTHPPRTPTQHPTARIDRPNVRPTAQTKKPKILDELLEMTTPRSISKTFSFCDRSRETPPLPKTSDHLKNYYICSMKDYNDIPFKNASIDRLTSETTIKRPLISRIVKSKVGREYEPKVRKRHMKP